MVNKPGASSNDAGRSTAGRPSRPQLEGDYFFVVLAVPVNGPRLANIMTPPVTWHFMRHVVAGGAQSEFELQLAGTGLETEKALHLEVLDLDESFTSEEEVRQYLEGAGRGWLRDAIDYRICRATIRRRAVVTQ